MSHPRFLPLCLMAIFIFLFGGVLDVTAGLRVDDSTKNFGQVEQGEPVTSTFVLENTGESTLVIENMRVSMPGMQVRVKPDIAPGASADVSIHWDTAGFSGDISGQVMLLLKDPRMEPLVLTVTGKVVAPVEVLPMPAFYLSQYQGEAQAGQLTIRNNASQALMITRVEPASHHFTADVETIREGKEYRLVARVAESTPIGRYRESLLVHTDSAMRPRMRIEVNILVKPDVYLTPDVADFGSLSASQLQRTPGMAELTNQTFIVKKRHGLMRITDVESDIPFLKLETTPAGASSGFRLEAGLDFGRLEAGPFSGIIVLRTDDSGHPIIEIPVSGSILP